MEKALGKEAVAAITSRDLQDQPDVEALQTDAEHGLYLFTREIDLTKSAPAGSVSRNLSWLGWNHLAWHIRDFNPSDTGTPAVAPFAGLCEGKAASGALDCPSLKSVTVVFESEDRTPLSDWTQANGFKYDKKAPRATHHADNYTECTCGGLQDDHREAMQDFSRFMYVREGDLGSRARGQFGAGHVVVVSAAKIAASQLPDEMIIGRILSDPNLKPGRYAILFDSIDTPVKPVETQQKTIAGQSLTMRRATFPVGGEIGRFRYATAWIFKKPGDNPPRRNPFRPFWRSGGVS